MTDYQETQLEELEVLESIFPEEYKELTREPTVTFEITLKPDEGTEKSEELTLAFELPPTYPDVAPEITTSSAKIQPQLLNKLKRELDEMALENIGDVMVFVIASHAKEWLDTRMDGVLEEVQSQNTEEELKKLKEKEWLAGTAVTKENFAKWAKKFEAEQDKIRNKDKSVAASNEEKAKANRKTGKELFLSGDKAILTSELALLDDGDEAIDVKVEHQLEIDEAVLDDQDMEKLKLNESSAK